MYSDILFDADDTLLDFQKAQAHGFKDVLHHYGVEFTSHLYEIYTRINHNLWMQFEKGSVTKDYVQAQRFSEFFGAINKCVDGMEASCIYQSSLQNQNWLIPYAKEVCEHLSKKYTISIITNGVGQTQMHRITSSAISPFISHIMISEDIGFAKPDKRFFEYVIDKLNCNPEKMLIIGDSLSSDIQGANNANIDAYWYNPNMHQLGTKLFVKGEITDLRQLLDVL